MAIPEVAEAIVFGSRAHGDADDRSDLDLALSCPGITRQRWLEIADAVDQAETLIHIDLVSGGGSRSAPRRNPFAPVRCFMSERKRKAALANLERALTRLEEALAVPEDAPLAIDGTIQRFEFALELTWKSLKRVLADEGIETRTPREAMTEAFRAYWIDHEALWLSMLRDRNATL